ncbi:hypothetical protein L9F63_013001, partial [Diploptera punctata]
SPAHNPQVTGTEQAVVSRLGVTALRYCIIETSHSPRRGVWLEAVPNFPFWLRNSIKIPQKLMER